MMEELSGAAATLVDGAEVERAAIARRLRCDATDAERRLWLRLRDRGLGAKFRRQQVLGRFVVDFACLDRRLVVELDGGQHAESAADRARDAWLATQGFRVLRFWNPEVMANIDGVLAVVQDALAEPR